MAPCEDAEMNSGRDEKSPWSDAPYTPDWSSLRRHTMPEWLDGMKFGIYCHWGPQTVQIAHLDEELDTLAAIDRWTGESFSAKAWVDLFEAAGAQFAGPVAWHGSGVLNWDSTVTDWTSVNRGPKVDIFGELAGELRKRDLKVVSSYHTSTIWGTIWGPMSRGNPTYLDPREDNSGYGTSNQGRIGDDILDGWFDRISEAIDTYQPDIVFFDTGFGGTVPRHLKGDAIGGRLLPEGENEISGVCEPYQQKLICHYFNRALEWGKEVEVTFKTFDIPPGIGMRDVENGNLIGLQYDPWIADINMAHHLHYPAPWFYNPKNPMKDAKTLIHMLADMTSKNGRMLLNVPPKPDGTFSEEQVKILRAVGDWLKVNGEAIYGTMPWVFFGEGPTEVTSPGHHGQGKEQGKLIPTYTAEDIRYTQKGRDLYAICLGWPGTAARLRTLGHQGKLYPGEVKSVHLLGHDGALEWEHDADALRVRLPVTKPCEYAYALKIQR